MLKHFLNIHRFLLNGLKSISTAGSPTFVLTYHHILDTDFDPLKLAVNLKNFEEQLIYLKNNFEIKSALSRPEENTRPAIILTFDDGYTNHLTNALPLLEKYQIPATFFITSNFIGEKYYYWDLVTEFCYLNLDLSIFHDFFSPLDLSLNKERLINTLCILIKALPIKERQLLSLRLLNALPISSKIKYKKTMNIEEIKQLAKHPLVLIGAHSVNHYPISELRKDDQKYEITESLKSLEILTQNPIKLFAYPYGNQNDFNTNSREIMQELNLINFTTIPGFYRTSSKSFEIPRIHMENGDINQFKKILLKTYFRPSLQ